VSSDWNRYLDRKLALTLGLEASRLADAIARNTLGWNTRANEIGQHLLRDEARLHGRSFERARDELVDVGLLRFSRGSGGRGHRDGYELLLDEETPADERANRSETPAETPAQTPAPERARKEKGEVKNSALPSFAPKSRERAGWPEGLGQRTLGDLLAACSLVESFQTGIDRGTLRAFVVDELVEHDEADFDWVRELLTEKRVRGGLGTPPELIRSEAAFARSVLRDLALGYESRDPRRDARW
jgi:hypothetical protein